MSLMMTSKDSSMDIYAHLKERNVNINLHRPIIDEENCIATYLLYNLSGQIIGYQQYNPLGDKKINNKPKAKYYTYVSKNKSSVVLYGLESLHLTDGVIYVTEGIYDAMRLTNKGQTALATLTNSPSKDVINQLKLLNRPIVVVCDNDDAGRKLAKCGDYVEVVEGAKDLAEAPESYVDHLIKKYGGVPLVPLTH